MSTALKAECPQCGKVLKITAEQVGQRVRCPGCYEAFAVTVIGISKPESLAALSTTAFETQDASSASVQGSRPMGGMIGRFELRAELGRGGFGQVYRAYDPVLEREVALKLPHFTTTDESRRRRFVQEAKSAAKLKHPQIVAVFESGDADGQPYIVAEFVSGETLAQRLKRELPEIIKVVSWIRDLAEALAYAHHEGIVHRDIKPENIMLGADDRPQIMDFGLAKRADEDSSLTMEGSVLGTPAYMSPEQARGDVKQVGPASDQYSLGATLYQLLTGQPPFSGPPHKVVAAVTSVEPAEPRRLNPAIPADLQAIIQKAMNKDPARRYAEISLFASDLDRWLRGETVRARPISLLERAMRWCGKNRTVAGLTTAVMVSSLLGTTITAVLWSQAARSGTEARKANSALQAQQQKLIDATKNAEAAANLATSRLAEVNEARAEADRQRVQAEDASRQSNEQRRLAVAEKNAADEARLRTETLVIESYFERGQSLCESGDPGLGMLWMSRALTLCQPAAPMEHLLRRSIGYWRSEVDELTLLTRLKIEVPEGKSSSMSVAAFSPLRTIVLVASNSGWARLFSTSDGQPLGPSFQVWPDNRSSKCIVSDPGKILIWNDHEYPGKPDAALFDGLTGKQIPAPKLAKILFRSAAFSPNGETIVAAEEQAAQLWDVTTGTRNSKRNIPKALPWLAAYLKEAPIVIAMKDNSLKFINAESGAEEFPPCDLTSNSEGSRTVRQVAFSADGTFVAATFDDNRVHLWKRVDAKTSNLWPIQIEHHGYIGQLAFSPDGKWLTSSSEDGRVGLLKLETQDDFQQEAPLPRFIKSPGASDQIAFDPDGLLMKVSGGVLRKWRLRSRNETAPTEVVKFHRHLNGGVSPLRVSPDEKTILSGHPDAVILWDAKFNKRHEIPMPNQEDAEFSQNSQMIAVSARDNQGVKVSVWDVASGKQIGDAINAKSAQPIAFDGDDSIIIGVGKSLDIFQIQTGTRVRSIDRNERVSRICLGSEPGTAVLGNNFGFDLMSTADWTPLKSSPRQISQRGQGDSWAMVVSPQKNAVSASYTGFQTWNIDSDAVVSAVRKEQISNSHLLGAAIEPAGRLAAVFSDKQLRLWDVATGTAVGRPILYNSVGYDVGLCFMDDGQRLIVGLDENIIYAVKIPQPAEGTSDEIELQIQTLTGQKINQNGNAEWIFPNP